MRSLGSQPSAEAGDYKDVSDQIGYIDPQTVLLSAQKEPTDLLYTNSTGTDPSNLLLRRLSGSLNVNTANPSQQLELKD